MFYIYIEYETLFDYVTNILRYWIWDFNKIISRSGINKVILFSILMSCNHQKQNKKKYFTFMNL